MKPSDDSARRRAAGGADTGVSVWTALWLLLLGAVSAPAQTGSGWDASWSQVGAPGSGQRVSGDYTLGETVSQAAGPRMSGANWVVVSGFWAGASADCNGNTVDDDIDILLGDSLDCDSDGLPDECEQARWVGADGGSFDDPGAWDPPRLPVSDVLLSNSANVDNRCRLVDSVGDVRQWELCRVELESIGMGRQILEIGAGNVFRAGVATEVRAGGEIVLRGGELAGGPVTNHANTISGFGIVSTDVSNLGRIEGVPGSAGHILSLTGDTLDNLADGMLQARIGSLLLVESATLSQAGEIEVRTAAAAVFSASLVNQSGGLISLLGGSLGSSGSEGVISETGADIRGFGTLDASVASEGIITTIADFQIVGDLTNDGTVFIQNGTLTITGNLGGSGTILGGFGGREGVTAGVSVFGDFTPSLRGAGTFDMTHSVLQMNGDPSAGPQQLEVLAPDASGQVALPDVSLFSIGTLRIGPMPTVVKLVDRHVNSPNSVRRQVAPVGREALYVERLLLEPGVVLDVAGLRIYYAELSPAPRTWAAEGISVVDSVGGGGIIPIGDPSQPPRPSLPGKRGGLYK